jgi:hypothetical protein
MLDFYLLIMAPLGSSAHQAGVLLVLCSRARTTGFLKLLF